MRTSVIGDLEVSVIGLGCNNFGRALDLDGTKAVVDAALEAGITFFDTAANYGGGQSEALLGVALGSRRRDVILATKFGVPRPDEGSAGASPAYIRGSVERSLRALNTDVIDLYQIHQPDPDVPIAETLGALWELQAAGKVREIGCSNFDVAQTAAALARSDDSNRPRFVSNQVHYSLVHREPESTGLAQLCLSERVALLPYYPLASGLLTGKVQRGTVPEGRLSMDRYQRFLTDRNFAVAETLVGFAQDRGIPPGQAALAWLLSRPAVPAVTPGATKPDQVRANAAAANVRLADGDIADLDALVGSA